MASGNPISKSTSTHIFAHEYRSLLSARSMYFPKVLPTFIVTLGSNSAVVDEVGAPTLELLTAHLVSDLNLVTMSLDIDPEVP